MPLIDFKCNSCGYTDEFIVGPTVSEPAPEVCPKCGKGIMERQFSAAGQSFDVVGGYSYTYGKKSYVNQSPEQRSKYLVKDAAGKYQNPY
jgi:putative FmdB family regulatory protein